MGVRGTCRNGSEEPVYDLDITLGSSAVHWSVPLMRPHEDSDFHTEVPLAQADYPRLSVEFTDSSGRRWMREKSGELTPVRQD